MKTMPARPIANPSNKESDAIAMKMPKYEV